MSRGWAFGVILFLVSVFEASACNGKNTQLVTSPDKSLELRFCLVDGTPTYSVRWQNKQILESSRLGLELKKRKSLKEGFRLARVRRAKHDAAWEQPWGEERYIRDQHHEMKVELQQGSRRLDLTFRLFNDGLGFRYQVPAQADFAGEFEISREVTEFRFARDGEAWWIPAFHDKTYELLYQKSPLSQLGVVHTPLTIEMGDHVVSLHEAAVVDHPTMALRAKGGATLVAELTPASDGSGAIAMAPFQSPWRTLQIASTPADLLTSYLVLNLNEPSKIKDTSWIKPMKYMGIWWALHTGRGSWADKYPDLAATTENSIREMDRAKALGMDGFLIEGWNRGWSDGGFSYTESNPKFDLAKVSAHARKIGIKLIGHHETNGAVKNYENQLEAAFSLYQKLGVKSVKTGYVGERVEGGEFHYGQKMVRHHQHVVERAAAHKIALNVHEPVKDTGLRRTYPNLMTREGMRGTEYDAWSDAAGNPPSHTVVLPFTRGLSGPMDYTPGIFDLLIGGKRGENRIRTTLAKQLALYVVLYSPMQMAADLPEFYEKHPAFQFIRDVPVDWHTTRVPHAKIGDHVTIVRRDRNSQDWYVGSIAGAQARSLKLSLDFLPVGKTYCAQIYRDDEKSHWQSSPLLYKIEKKSVTAKDVLPLHLAPGGGQAIRLRAQACS